MMATNMGTMYQLRDQLLALDAADRDNLLALIEREEVRAKYQPTHQDEVVWASLVRLSPPGVQHRSLDQFIHDKGQGVPRKAWQGAVQTLYGFAAQAKPVRHTAEDGDALVEIILECLVSTMKGRDERVSPRAIIEALPWLDDAVDHAFPGYVQAGLLHLLIRLTPTRTR